MQTDPTQQGSPLGGSSSDAFPAWSPDGKKIVFQRPACCPTQQDIYVVDADGSNLTPLRTGTLQEFKP
jgi:Tol biopolymer transport system component